MAERIEVFKALGALRRLVKNPEATEEVFTIIRALSGQSFEREFKRFETLEQSQVLLNADRELLSYLVEDAAEWPPGSFGALYRRFLQLEGLSADGLVQASESENQVIEEPRRAKFGRRQRDQHDLWHTLTEYGRDELGELCLLAFTYAQTGNRGIAAIVVVGALKLRPYFGWRVFKAIKQAYRHGKEAEWLPGQIWEHLLTQPTADVRTLLQIQEPTVYWELRGGERFPSLLAH